MEITSFILGVGSVVLTALVTLVIYNTIKVYKMQKELERMNRDYYDMQSSFSRSLDETMRNIWDVMASDRKEIFHQIEKLETSKKK
jgi:hypothetical protein